MIPYAPGRDRITKWLIQRLNDGDTVTPISPAEIQSMNAIKATYPTLVQSQKAEPNLPAGFIPYKLGAPATQTPVLSAAICWFGTISQAAAAAPTVNEATATGLVLTRGRTSAGFYTISGLPTGYGIHAAVWPSDPDRAVTVGIAGQTITIKSYNHAVIGDDLLNLNNLMIILMPT